MTTNQILVKYDSLPLDSAKIAALRKSCPKIYAGFGPHALPGHYASIDYLFYASLEFTNISEFLAFRRIMGITTLPEILELEKLCTKSLRKLRKVRRKIRSEIRRHTTETSQ